LGCGCPSDCQKYLIVTNSHGDELATGKVLKENC